MQRFLSHFHPKASSSKRRDSFAVIVSLFTLRLFITFTSLHILLKPQTRRQELLSLSEITRQEGKGGGEKKGEKERLRREKAEKEMRVKRNDRECE